MNKKLLYFLDDPYGYLKISAQKFLDNIPITYTPWLHKKSKNKFSIVSAVYGVENYLDDFFNSIINQTLIFEEHVQIIMVDDGSLDGSADIIKLWVKKFPNNIQYLKKENGGQASARNLGLESVNTEWVTFIDPDDFISKKYFETVNDILISEGNLGLISCNYIYYKESEKKIIDNHPLNYRFEKNMLKLNASDLQKHIQLSVNSVFFKTKIIHSNSLLMDSRVIPNFEDAHFVCRYLLLIKNSEIVFTRSAKYFYRKRQSSDSTLDKSWTSKEQFNDKLLFGHLDLLNNSTTKVPEFIQRTILYDLIWYMKALINKNKTLSFLTEDERAKFIIYLKLIFSRIDKGVIEKFELVACNSLHKTVWLGLNKKNISTISEVEVIEFDEKKGLIKVHYFYNGEVPLESIHIGNEVVFPKYTKIREHDFLGDIVVFEKLLWFSVENVDKSIIIEINNRKVFLSCRGNTYKSKVNVSQLIETFKKPIKKESEYTFGVGILRKLALYTAYFPVYQNYWVFIDRDNQADDNAEHLYRFVSKTKKGFKGCFLLRKDSHDWCRLEKEGFNLVKFGSIKHMIIMFNARYLISSHADNYVVSYPPKSWFEGILKYKYIFLQHGVTKDDLSNWFNGKDIAALITATKKEYESIAGKKNRYKFTSKEVYLTGFARHDGLLQKFNKSKSLQGNKRTLLIMPTWRESLVGKKYWMSNKRRENDVFYSSDYSKYWKQFLHSAELKLMVEEYDLEIIFFPHANMTPYIDWFEVPTFINPITHKPEQSIQDLFVESSLLITDYSSVAFEMAYLKKPVIYYQFDSKDVYGNGHMSVKGYYDYEKNGFGPVCENESQVLTYLKKVLVNKFEADDIYIKRSQNTFEFQDGKCCERIYDVILDLDISSVLTK